MTLTKLEFPRLYHSARFVRQYIVLEVLCFGELLADRIFEYYYYYIYFFSSLTF